MTDVSIISDPSVCLVSALTDKAREWVEDFVDREEWNLGESFACERGYIENLTIGMLEAGLTVEVDGQAVYTDHGTVFVKES